MVPTCSPQSSLPLFIPEDNSPGVRATGRCGQAGRPRGVFPYLLSAVAAEQEAGAAGDSPGPVALGLLATGKGNGGSTPRGPCALVEGRVGCGLSPWGSLSGECRASRPPPPPGGVGCVAGLCAGEEAEEGAARAGGADLPAAAPPGGRHAPPAVRSWREGPPAAAAFPAAGAGRPRVTLPFSWGAGGPGVT